MKKYISKPLWKDLIEMGRSNGLTDNEISDRIIESEQKMQNVLNSSPTLFNMLKKKAKP